MFLGASFLIIWGIVIWMLIREYNADATDVPASWFGILNSFFIIAFAPIFSKIWASKLNPSGPVKFAIGLILLGLGFAILAYGGSTIPQGAKTASVSMLWLILAYLFHTLGELCISPVGLSYVSKLAPVRLVGLMFGIWFVANFIANWTAGITGSYIDAITEKYSITTFFLIFTFIPIGAGLVMLALNGMLKKKMHGIR
jgi:POT family proton-dependent oligopeptide transporter